MIRFVEGLGPLGWRNWKLFDEGFPGRSERSEATFYSDAQLDGSAVDGLGPYQVLNALADPRQGVGPRLVLRMQFGVELDPSWETTEESGFHGGDVYEELAALVSLALGIRCRSGGQTRIWADSDPLGHPIEYDHRPPYLPHPGRYGPMLPRIAGTSTKAAEILPLLQLYRAADSEEAIALVRASRLYQQAIWIADADPNQSWLMLVSALEVAADRLGAAKVSPMDRLREAWSDLADLLEPLADDVADSIARLLAPLVKSKRAYLSLIERFAPEPPPDRPEEAFQVDWTRLREYADTIYNYRSRALHAGTPFPGPMCESPLFPHGDVVSEKPFGLGTQINESMWLPEATPMLLATFEYVARETLHSWWRSLAEPA
jgi:hypothetical protein